MKWFRLLPDTKAKTVYAYLFPIIYNLPRGFVKSLTLDNGPEFAFSEFIKLEEVFDQFKVYYCDPYCSFQKGAVERSNRDFRIYFPKGTDFGQITKDEVREVEKKLNNTQIKCLNWKTPQQILNLHLDEFIRSASLAA